ncbi:MAG TPA: hypothetical protein VJ747_17490, partial [Stellaceae bacterium]|nr:hypothetical protein [Stellaceae bacterium]
RFTLPARWSLASQPEAACPLQFVQAFTLRLAASRGGSAIQRLNATVIKLKHFYRNHVAQSG